MDLGLAGKTALVAGATGGIGRAVALALAEEGCRVALVARDAARLAEVCEALSARGTPCLALAADVTDPAAWAEVRRQVEGTLAPVSVLVYAAAAADRPARVASIPPEHWQQVLDTDLTGFWRASACFLPGMASRGFGRVIALGSLMGHQGGFAEGAYAAAKAGLGGLVKTIALENARTGVTANLVVPGRITTERTAGVSDRAKDAIRQLIPMRREGTPEEVASVVAFLASQAASYVTGAEVPVTGGRELGATPS